VQPKGVGLRSFGILRPLLPRRVLLDDHSDVKYLTAYPVVDYLNGVKYPDLVAEGTTGELEASFDSYLLLRLERQ